MFWGIILEPNKPYTQVVEKPFRISMAALDVCTGHYNDECQVWLGVDNKRLLLCTLDTKYNKQASLHLDWQCGHTITFSITGTCNVHLTGYYL